MSTEFVALADAAAEGGGGAGSESPMDVSSGCLESSIPTPSTYIVQRKDRFYVVAYDGLDRLTRRVPRRVRLP